jgi:hypothetical protein
MPVSQCRILVCGTGVAIAHVMDQRYEIGIRVRIVPQSGL